MKDNRSHTQLAMSRRKFLATSLGVITVAAAPQFAGTPAYARNAGRYKNLSMYSAQSGESIDLKYWIDGDYIDEAITEISWFMRDWRVNKSMSMATDNLDTLAAIQLVMNVERPMQLLSGYRTRATNDWLRRRGSGTARNSLHIEGMAADFRVHGRPVSKVASVAEECQAGGVGKYSRAGFVHVDCGDIRSWGR
ncbi:MAG: DUF882 domain-containing protein [Rhodobacteraceae bacterium]|nr:DUF882 domain-containing protein [Paracoccaceae bacterium]